MDSKVTAFAATQGVTFGQPPPATIPASAGGRPEGAASGDPNDLRLVIEEDKGSGSYVYKTINRLTGEVIQSLPRAEVLRLREEAKYVAGTVIRTKA